MVKLGSELKAGDTIVVWWKPHRDVIISLYPYSGAYQDDTEFMGARIATFALLQTGMTIFADDVFEVIKE